VCVVGELCWVVVEDVGWLCDVFGMLFLVGIFEVFLVLVSDLFVELLFCYVCIYGLFMVFEVAVWFGFGFVVVGVVFVWFVVVGCLVEGEL